ncbi:unnamed protein product [Psylliodes chrysocephalus]|uniref:Uncharacterized protein n=1 Tax=Psylliodes chrysocephalus TaxID=3402493 RepID=A0A9P0D142_9CUCU|nr:unnamed protein product [Psylliodes chrysocephala]
MYMFALMKYPKIKSITHKYLITGHTQNEGDAVHSTIEKAIKKNLRSGPIYVPSQYALIIRSAKKRGKPFNVNEMSFKDFFLMKNLAEDIGFNTKNLKTSEIKIFKVIQGESTKVFYKNFQTISIKKAYKCRPKIKENKKRDLLSLVESNHIPNFYGTFYINL